jgi:hypothetical protein
MNFEEYSRSKREELVTIASGMLSGSISILEGVRKLCLLRFEIGDPYNPNFHIIVAFDSETDKFPTGEARAKFAPDYLRRLDEELQDLSQTMKEPV